MNSLFTIKNYFILFKIFLLFLAVTSCNENDPPLGIHGKVELFEVEQFETIDNTDQIDETTVVTKKIPLVKYEDLLSYDSKEYKFDISEHGRQLFEDPPVKTGAFAIKANGELIYTGYFVPGYSSRLWLWNIIDPLMIDYSGDCHVRRITLQGGNIPSYPDKRNDPSILAIFRRDKKLIE